ncbi:MAG TPA: M23 family metallopeptidase [Wenzhouxiangellaceae bacterium]|nr:M23 family metallopeptidase [Wenzhouxiangellaceae bacterium]
MLEGLTRRLAILLVWQLSAVSAMAAASDDDVGLLELQGEAVQGGLIIGQAPAGAEVELDGERLRHAANGYFLIGFGRDETAPRRLVVRAPGGATEVREFRPEPREFDIQRIDGLPPSQVTPDPESLERIRREAGQVREARTRLDARTDFADGFIWPVHGPITGVYGSQRILNGEPRSPHWGVDLAAPTGTPVVAPAAGVVTLAHPDMYFSGGTLMLDHGLGLSSAFLHLDEILVEPGQRVEQGDPIARVGATGRVTGAHLDWRMNLGETRIDPQLLIDAPPRTTSR